VDGRRRSRTATRTRSARGRAAPLRSGTAGHRIVRLATAATLAACAGLGGVRPFYGPVPGSVSLQLAAAPDAVTRAAAEEVQHAGLVLQWMSPTEGYVETLWFNVTTRASAPSADIGDLEHSVKIRLFADPTAGKTRLVAEVVTTYAVDPSRPQREMERMAAEGHPGREVLTQILDRLKQRFPGTDSTRTAR
jgi:hypothetical protein